MVVDRASGNDCDYLIIGGGSAGCALASRLSEDPSLRVVLAEAGEDAAPAAVEDARFRTLNDPRFLWPGLTAEYSSSGIGPLPFGQARIIGGGSAINGMHAQRGSPADYDEWRQLGVVGWGWDDVLPYFRKLETDCDFDGALHGKTGPVRVRRVPDKDWSGLSQAFAATLRTRGMRRLADINAETGDGFGAVPLNIDNGRRLSSASVYLTREVRARPNLRIETGRTASRILTEGGRAIGAEFAGNGGVRVIRARETIVSSGALHSPALLLRSGIGPAAQLQKAGVYVVRDAPGVGANLLNHPMFIVAAHVRSAGRPSSHVQPPCPMLVRYSSDVPGAPATDMLINIWERAPNTLSFDPLGRQLANLMVIINKVYSQGSVTLAPDGALQVKFNLLDDVRDRDRMVAALRFLAALLHEPAVAKLVNAAFLPAMSPLAFLLMQDNWKAQLLSIAGAAALSGPVGLRNRILKDAGTPIDAVLADEAALDTVVRNGVLPGGHVAGTCRMGDPGRHDTVVDSACRVIGVDGLRVVDASIFPTLMAAGTNLPVIMAAEKVAAGIAKEHRA